MFIVQNIIFHCNFQHFWQSSTLIHKASEKPGTFKDISLFGSFEFPTSGPNTGGVIARSLAGIGKESKKTEQQLKSLANRRSPIAGATGAVTSEEIPILREHLVPVGV